MGQVRTQLLPLSKPCPAGYLPTSLHSLVVTKATKARPGLRDLGLWVSYTSKRSGMLRASQKIQGSDFWRIGYPELMRVALFGEKHGTQVLLNVFILSSFKEEHEPCYAGFLGEWWTRLLSHGSSVRCDVKEC